MNKKDFEYVVQSKTRATDINIKEILKYKDLIFLFVKRDFVSRYKQTILGPAWAVIQPLLTTIVFTVVFGNLANLTTMDSPEQNGIIIPSFLFYMAGTICWNYFQGVFTTCSNTFISNQAIMGKVYFPRLVMPISTIASKLIDFGIQFAMFICFIVYFVITGGIDIKITPAIILVPVVVIQLGILGMGCGIIISALTTKYRDLAMLVTFGTELWRYGTPVAYGLTLVSQSSYNMWFNLYMMNPVSPIITTFRYAVFGSGYFDLGIYLISWLETIVFLVMGAIIFNKIEKTFMDTI